MKSVLKVAVFLTKVDFQLPNFGLKRHTAQKIQLEKVNIKVVKINDVVIQKLRQDVLGQLGSFCMELANANVNILAQYSDHSNRFIVVPDDYTKTKDVSKKWIKIWWSYFKK